MAWELKGNSNTRPNDPNGDFLGTTDAQALVVKTHAHEALRVTAEGNVGVGTPQPTSKLEIGAQDALQVVGFEPFVTWNDSHSGFKAKIQAAHGDFAFFTDDSAVPAVTMKKRAPGASALVVNAQDALQVVGFEPFMTWIDSHSGFKAKIQAAHGDFAFFTDNSAQPALLVGSSGDVTVKGNLSVTKDVICLGADCAERFDVLHDTLCDPGTVMRIGEGGALNACNTAYDRTVAGVVSGAGTLRPAILLDNRDDNTLRPPIALAGKVYCKVDARYGAVDVGDLLTSSETVGHAMKVTDAARALGAIVGKALAPLSEGQGLIPILVTLQ